MKAAQISEYGGIDKIAVVEIEKPTVAEGQVLIQVRAASLNPFDTTIRSGAYKDKMPLELPKTLGGDIAGTIVEVGSGVVDFAVGDKVYGQASVVAGNSGAFAEYAVTKLNQIAIAPSNINVLETASLPLVGVSAVQALTEHIKLHDGQKIFIHGGGGGIGGVAIQIAKHLGAYVATTATGKGISYVKQLGADEIIDYQEQDFSKLLSGYDAVLNTVGGDDFAKTYSILKSGAVAVSMIAQSDEDAASEKGITAMTQGTRVTKQRLDSLRDFVENGVIKPTVAKVFPLNDIQAAFEARESGGYMGKIVLEISK